MYPVSTAYFPAIRNSTRQTAVVDVITGGAIVPGGENLAITGGTVTDTSTPGVRRQLNVTLAPAPGLFDMLIPTGGELRVRSLLHHLTGPAETVPMGVYGIDTESMGYGPNGTLTVQGSDRWAELQRAKFLTPRASTPGLITAQVMMLISEVFPELPVVSNVDSQARVGSLVWDEDRAQTIIDLATSIGAWVYFDRNGFPTIDPLPTGPPTQGVWTVDAGEQGVLLTAFRSRDRSKTYNVVVVNSDKTDGTPLFDPQVVWDAEPASPTYAGTDPASGAGAGPFGIVTYKYSSPLLESAGQAQGAGRSILNRVTGLNAQLSMTNVRNHALDALDPLTVVLPPDRPDWPPIIEAHIADKITHPLMADGAQQIDTRSTRTDNPA